MMRVHLYGSHSLSARRARRRKSKGKQDSSRRRGSEGPHTSIARIKYSDAKSSDDVIVGYIVSFQIGFGRHHNMLSKRKTIQRLWTLAKYKIYPKVQKFAPSFQTGGTPRQEHGLMSLQPTYNLAELHFYSTPHSDAEKCRSCSVRNKRVSLSQISGWCWHICTLPSINCP